jgi:hypothetical protein
MALEAGGEEGVDGDGDGGGGDDDDDLLLLHLGGGRGRGVAPFFPLFFFNNFIFCRFGRRSLVSRGSVPLGSLTFSVFHSSRGVAERKSNQSNTFVSFSFIPIRLVLKYTYKFCLSLPVAFTRLCIFLFFLLQEALNMFKTAVELHVGPQKRTKLQRGPSSTRGRGQRRGRRCRSWRCRRRRAAGAPETRTDCAKRWLKLGLVSLLGQRTPAAERYLLEKLTPGSHGMAKLSDRHQICKIPSWRGEHRVDRLPVGGDDMW